MKLLGVLMSFALVGNVLVTKLDDYLQQVISINVAISEAKEFMPIVIKNMILNRDDYGMQAIAFMLSVPDRIDFELFRAVSYSDTDSDENSNVTPLVEAPEQNQIPFVDIVPEEGSIQLFDTHINPDQTLVINLDPEEGPSERQVPDLNLDPSTVPEEDINQDQIPVINLDSEEDINQDQIPDTNPDPSTVPEEVSISENPNIFAIDIIDFEEKFHFQKMMRLEILAVTDRPEYERIKELERKGQMEPIAVPAIKLEKIHKVLEERRIDPTAVTKKRIIRALGLDSLAKARREITLEAMASLIRQNDPCFRDLNLMGRLVGAFRSINDPSSFIISVDIQDDDHCIVIDSTGERSYLYRYIGDEIWEVDIDPDLDTDIQIRRLLSVLE